MPFAAFHLEEGRSDRPTSPAHLEAAEPATGIRGLSHAHGRINKIENRK
jgi:hypothetical protein